MISVKASINPYPSFVILNNWQRRRGAVRRVVLKCLQERKGDNDFETSSSSSAPAAADVTSSSSSSGISAYRWCAGLGGLGFLETVYLSYLKLTDSDVFCPIGGGGGGSTCGDILNSDYAIVHGE